MNTDKVTRVHVDTAMASGDAIHVIISSPDATQTETTLSTEGVGDSIVRISDGVIATKLHPIELAILEQCRQPATIWPDHKTKIALDECNTIERLDEMRDIFSSYTGSGIKIAVLDTGIDSTHADLTGRVASSVNFSAAGTTTDINGHGTHVASIIGGTGAASVGIYKGPAQGATLYNLKVFLDDGTGLSSSVIAAISWAITNGIDIINYSGGSLTPYDPDDPLTTAVQAAITAGLIVVAAAGNDGPNASTVHFPGSIPDVICVGNADKSGSVYSLSSRGPNSVGMTKPDVVAVGTSVVAAVSALSSDTPFSANTEYTVKTGTSMSTPWVAGLCALYLEAEPTATQNDVKVALQASCADLGLSANTQGSGRIDAVRSMRYILTGATNETFTADDIISVQSTVLVAATYTLNDSSRMTTPFDIQTAIHLTPTDSTAITDACFSIHTVNLPTTISVTDDLNGAVRAVLELSVLIEAQDTQTTSLVIATRLLETLVAQDVVHSIQSLSLGATLTLADQLSGAIQAQLAMPETACLLDALSTSLVVSVPLLTTASLLDRLGSHVALVLGETATLDDDAAIGASVQMLGAESLQVTAISELLAVLGVNLDEQAVLQAVQQLAQHRDATFDETATLTDTQRLGIQLVLAASEQVDVSDDGSLGITLMARLHETVNLDDLADVSISTWLNLTDGAAFIARLPLDGTDYQAWVMNAETTGTTQYTNFPMNSLFTFQGVPYGVSETGLYRLEGKTDDGAPINSVVATGDMNFGTSREKNIPRAYLYLTQTGQVVLKTISSRQGSRHETYYELAERTTDSTDDDTYRRVPLGRGVRGVWWRFELHALDGATINLDGAEIRPVVLSRRG